jgi:dTDP-4-dehydrorhamnose reductase
MKILVTGATGVLGNYLVNFLKNKSYKIFSLGFKKKTENNLDLNNKEKLFIFLKEIKPEVIINCAAFTNVNECENNFIKAYTNNALIVNSLVSVLFSLKMRPHLIHFSSDQVYNQRGANSESNVKLSNNYSVAKYISEIEARYYNKATILRTNFYGKSYLSYRGSFSDYIISFLSKKKNVKLPINIFFNPINLNILSILVEKFIVKKKYGTFNIGSKKIIS